MSKPTVLIVDDDPVICEEVASGLQRHGFPTRWTTSPASNFRSDGFVPEVIVLDLNMPDLDGFQVIALLAGFDVQPQLVVASGHDERIIAAAVRNARSLGMVVLGGIEKPYSIKTLVARLDAYRPAADSATDLELFQRVVADGTIKQHMRVAFQSKRRLSDDAVVGYEALTRVVVGRPISPEVVFSDDVALDAKLEMTEIVLDEAMRFAAQLAARGGNLPVAVNCSPQILCEPPLMVSVAASLQRHDMPYSSLLIELTEHNALNSLDDVAASASRFALRGAGIVVDDFGKGTTSYEKLLQLPLTELKIDKDIFWMAMSGRIAVGMLHEITQFCHRHGIVTTVEGIETNAHRTAALALGADFGQGYFWDRPALGDDILAELASETTGSNPT